MTTAAIYARVSSARQKEDQTIASQTAALRETAERLGLEIPTDWVFEDEGYSGATLIRPALERFRDLAAQVPVDVVLCYSPDRLARRYAYQALLIDEFARAGTDVRFVIGPKGETPEDELVIQFQGMIAEYERAQIVERTRHGKAHRAERERLTCSRAPHLAIATCGGARLPMLAMRSSKNKQRWCRDVPPLHRGLVLDRRTRSLAQRRRCRHRDGEGALGPLDGLGDASQSRLCRTAAT